jgi:hypothetical protein
MLGLAQCFPLHRADPADDAGGNMLDSVHSLAVSCHLCHHEAIISAAPWPDDVPVPFLGRVRCANIAGSSGPMRGPNWREHLSPSTFATRTTSWVTAQRAGETYCEPAGRASHRL